MTWFIKSYKEELFLAMTNNLIVLFWSIHYSTMPSEIQMIIKSDSFAIFMTVICNSQIKIDTLDFDMKLELDEAQNSKF